ncbi:MAG: SDR family NAD(P)-dependent oxidoreductase [Acidimicrobiales bacterium]
MTDSTSLRKPGRRNVVITGAGRGLGLGLAKRFAERGDHVVGTARSPAQAEKLAGVAEQVVALDMASDASIDDAASALADLGHIDVLINNAGINATAVGASDSGRGTMELGREHFLAVMDVNAAGPMLVTRSLVPLLQEAKGSLVINVSSQLGAMTFGDKHGNDIAYNASKAALNMVTVRTATDLAADDVALVAIHPGWVRTDMGGAAASLGIDESSSAIANTIDGLTLLDSGRFLRWDGTDHDW